MNPRVTGGIEKLEADLWEAADNLRANSNSPLLTTSCRFRHAKGLSQEDLAYEANVNRSYMSKLEKGATYPGLEIIGKLATVLGVEPAELLTLPRKRRTRSR
jgi:DNA-binding XRE family transcriptional regulator